MDTPCEIVPFSHEKFGKLRTMSIDGEPWFVAADVARALGYGHTPHMTRRLDEDEKGVRSVDTPGGIQQLSVISEAGLYSAVLGSKVPGAKAFKRWVTHEVLPSIRAKGGYMVAREGEDAQAVIVPPVASAYRPMPT